MGSGASKCSCAFRKGIEGSGGGGGIQFSDTPEDLLLGDLIHPIGGVAIYGIGDECLMPFGEWILLDEDSSIEVVVVRASDGDHFADPNGLIQFSAVLPTG